MLTPHYLQTAERQEQGNSCTSTTVRLPLLLGNFLELRLKRLRIAQPSCWLQPFSSLAGFSPFSSLYLPLFAFPPHANPTLLFHFLLTQTRFY